MPASGQVTDAQPSSIASRGEGFGAPVHRQLDDLVRSVAKAEHHGIDDRVVGPSVWPRQVHDVEVSTGVRDRHRDAVARDEDGQLLEKPMVREGTARDGLGRDE